MIEWIYFQMDNEDITETELNSINQMNFNDDSENLEFNPSSSDMEKSIIDSVPGENTDDPNCSSSQTKKKKKKVNRAKAQCKICKKLYFKHNLAIHERIHFGKWKFALT